MKRWAHFDTRQQKLFKRQAREWRSIYTKHVQGLVAACSVGVAPSGSDAGNPMLWKGIHWRWLENEDRADETARKYSSRTRSDTERLDWLTTHDAYIAHARDGDCCWLAWPAGRDGDSDHENQKGNYSSPRDAIDAAMDEEL